jgi:hypothetical protein
LTAEIVLALAGGNASGNEIMGMACSPFWALFLCAMILECPRRRNHLSVSKFDVLGVS